MVSVRLALSVGAGGLLAVAAQATVPITLASTGTPTTAAAVPVAVPATDQRPPYLEAGFGAAALLAAAAVARRRKPLREVVS